MIPSMQAGRVVDAVRRAAERVAELHPEIAAVYLFGSVARGQARPWSDVDLGVVYRTGAEERAHELVAVALADAVARETGRERVDVVDLAAQGHYFQHRVLCEATRVLVRDEDRRIDFESEAIVRGIDFAPTFALATAGKATALRAWLKERDDLRASSVEAGPTASQPRTAR